MVALMKIYSCTTIGLILNGEQKTGISSLSNLLIFIARFKKCRYMNFDGRYLYSYNLN